MRRSFAIWYGVAALSLWLACLFPSHSAAEMMRSATNPGAAPPRPPFRVPRIAMPSGYVFSGTVTGVQPIAPAKAGGVGMVQITFHVDEGLRGVKTGQSLTIREWAGLWHSGQRYQPGERVFLFLYQPSRLGLTSTVGGALGRFQVDANGTALLSPAQMNLISRNPAVTEKLRGRARIRPADLFHLLRNAEERQP